MGGIFFSNLPNERNDGLTARINPHELSHLFFKLDDEYKNNKPYAVNEFNILDPTLSLGDEPIETWSEIKWAPWINFPNISGENSLFDNDNLHMLTQNQMNNYVGDYNTVLAFPKNSGFPVFNSTAKNFSPCATCLMRDLSNQLCIICKEGIYNNLIDDVVTGFSPTTGKLLSSSRKGFPPLNSLDLVETRIVPNQTILLRVECTDRFLINFDNQQDIQYTYEWFLRDSISTNKISDNPNELSISYNQILEDDVIYFCKIKYSNKNIIRVNPLEKLNKVNDEFFITRDIWWHVVKSDLMYLKNKNIDLIIDENNDNPFFFSLNITGNTVGANITILKSFEHGSLDSDSFIDGLVYTPTQNEQFVGLDTCEFKVTNSKGTIVQGLISINHTTVQPQLFNKEISVQSDSNGNFPIVEATLKNGTDYISRDSYVSISMNKPVKGKFITTKKFRPGPNNVRLEYRPNKNAVGSETIPMKIWDNTTNTYIFANLIITFQ